ncbi:MAG: hypothetical protein LBC74_05840 [Planctomycetaceae bacterium]|nr:hypothetical protein [Planctomycetaceae bacterium]
MLRRSNTNSQNSRSGKVANNRNNNKRIIAPSPNRVGGSRSPVRNSETARSIANSNLRKSPPYRHQPSPTTVKNVRKNFHGYNNYWTADWYRRHPNSWRPVAIPERKWWHRQHWHDTWNWFDTAFFTGVFLNKMLNRYSYYPYYYGNNIVYNGDMVYVNGVPYVSSAEYYRQALELARTADALVKAEAEKTPETIIVNLPANEPAPSNQPIDEGWLPMGTFALLTQENENENIKNVNVNEDVNDTQNISQEILQIAVNKMGQVRGNFVDEKNNSIRQMIGAIDPKTQRVALRFADDDKIVWECGLWNLTQDTLPVLIHSGETQIEQKTLIRLVDDNGSELESDGNEIELAP